MLNRGLDGSFTFSVPMCRFAVLWYRPERRLSVSVWFANWSRNFRIWGARKLSFER